MSEIVDDLLPLAVPLDRLSALPGNPRRGDVEAVARSYRTFGQRKPIVARRQEDGTGVVIAGNHQFAAAQSLGWEKIAVVWVDDDDETAAAFALADNRTAELGSYDDEALAAMIQSVDDEELLRATGWDNDAVAALLETLAPDPVVEEDEVPESPEKPRASIGDVWQVGPHRVICGDSTDPAVYEKLLDGATADFVFTDPPYGVDVQERDLQQAKVRGRRKDGKGVLNDALDEVALAALLDKAFELSVASCRPGASWYVCSPPGDLMVVFGEALIKHGLGRHSLSWVKDAFVMGRSDYHYRHEVIFYGWVPGAAHDWYADRKQDSVWEFPRPKRSPEHPTMKPVELVAYAMQNSSKRGDKVLDPFCGSGTTLVAAAQMGRIGYGIELHPPYVDVIVSRLEAATGETAELVS